MLNFYKTQIHLNLEIDGSRNRYAISPDSFISGIHNCYERKIWHEALDGLRPQEEFYMTIGELRELLEIWNNRSGNILEDEELDNWFTLYLKCHIEVLEREKKIPSLFTYTDAYMLQEIKNALKGQYVIGRCYRDLPPEVEPELSWKLYDYLKGHDTYAEDLLKVVKKNLDAIIAEYQKTSILGNLVKVPTNLLFASSNDLKLSDINWADPEVTMLFQNPFTISDFETNYLYIRKIIAKYGSRRLCKR